MITSSAQDGGLLPSQREKKALAMVLNSLNLEASGGHRQKIQLWDGNRREAQIY